MKKIFILTGEPSGDKLASTVISKLKSQNSDICSNVKVVLSINHTAVAFGIKSDIITPIVNIIK